MFVIMPVLWSIQWTLHGDSECNGFYNSRYVWILPIWIVNRTSMMTVYELWGGKLSGGKILVYVNNFLKICTTQFKSIQRHPRKSPLVVWTQTITPFPAGFVQIDTRVSFSSFPRFLWRSGFTIRRIRICLWNGDSLLSATVILIFPLNGSLLRFVHVCTGSIHAQLMGFFM